MGKLTAEGKLTAGFGLFLVIAHLRNEPRQSKPAPTKRIVASDSRLRNIWVTTFWGQSGLL